MSDWIKVHRRLLDSDVFANPITLKVWIWLLLKANYKDRLVSLKTGKGFEDVVVKRGKVLYGRKTASEKLKISEGCVRNHIEKLEKIGKISVKTTSHYSIITICKYDVYQITDEQLSQPNVQPNVQPSILPNGQPEATPKKDKKEEEPIGAGFKKTQLEDMIVLEMMKTWKAHNPSYYEEPELDYSACLEMAYKIAKMKKWEKKEVLNGKMQDTLMSWGKIVVFVKYDAFLKKLSLCNLNSQWQNIVQKMSNTDDGKNKKSDQEKELMKKLGL